jgi:predicted O-linked N-acetylglucosamine transferase (SPINDLY family)
MTVEQILQQARAHDQAGRAEQAIATYRRILQVDPKHIEASEELAVCLIGEHRIDEAIQVYWNLLNLCPKRDYIYNNLGNALRMGGKPSEAVNVLRQAIDISPSDARIHSNLGFALSDLGHSDEAIAAQLKALEFDPKLGAAHNNLGFNFHVSGRIGESISCFNRALQLDPGNAEFHSNIVFAAHYDPGFDAKAILRVAQEWNQKHVVPLRSKIQPHNNDCNPSRRLRIGYVSADLRDHVAGWFLAPLLKNHDPQKIEIFCYSNSDKIDGVTDHLRDLTARWRNIAHLSDEQAAAQIREDRIDVLVDLSMHSGLNRGLVFARKPAPVQVTWLAYPGTTGNEAIDYRLSDPYFDPPGTDEFYSEQTIRLPETYMCFNSRGNEEPISELPALRNGFVTFGGLNHAPKINADVIALWSRVLRAVDKSKLLLFAQSASAWDRMIAEFERNGIAAERIERVRRQPWANYLQLYHRVDVVLDTFPFNGGATSLDAFWMGVPVITLVGQTVAGRAGWSQLSNLKLTEFAAHNEDEFVQLAKKLASDLNRLSDLRRTLRPRMLASPLMDAPRFARNVEAAYREMWQRYCATRNIDQSIQQTDAIKEVNEEDPAIAGYRQAIQLDPKNANAMEDLAACLIEKERVDEAIEVYQDLSRLRPNQADVYNNLGVAFKTRGNLVEAIAAFHKALAINPKDARIHSNLGFALSQSGQVDEAIKAHRRALQIDPSLTEAMTNLGFNLHISGKAGEAMNYIARALQLKPESAEIHSIVVFSMHYQFGYDSGAILQAARRWSQQHAEPLRSKIQPHNNDCNPSRRLRIGYVSPDFRNHVVGWYLMPLLKNHDHKKFEVFCYSNSLMTDFITDQLRDLADHWRTIAGLSDQEVAQQIGEDHIDVLVDLSMYRVGNRALVFARKPAPVQVTWLAYPGTTGMEAIDYRLTDPYLDPPGTDKDYSEKTVRLPDTFWCFDPLDNQEPVAQLPALRNGFVTFGCLNLPSKINEEVIALWSKVLRAVDRSKIILLSPSASAWDRVIASFARNGISADRLERVERQPRAKYLKVYHQIDIVLDTLPYNGHTTSLDSLWMGVPVITLIGKTVVGRAGWSQLSNLKLTEFAAHNEDEFIQIAIKLASDLNHLSDLRRTLRARMEKSPLMDAPRFARNVEAAYREMWQRYCARRNSHQFVQKAMQHHQVGRLKEAEELYLRILEQSPDNSKVLHLRGVLAGQSRQFDLAIESIQKAIEIDSNQAEYYSDLGNVFLFQNQFDKAQAAYERAIKMKPDFPEAHYNLGIALGKQRKFNEASIEYRAALRYRADYAAAYFNLGATLTILGKLEEAVGCYREMIRRWPENPGAHLTLGNVLKDLGKLDEAIAEYHHALRLRPDAAEVYRNLASILKDQARMTDAIAAYRQALQLKPDDATLRSDFLFTLNYTDFDPASLLVEQKIWNDLHAAPLAKEIQGHTNDCNPNRRLRIGYVSPHFYKHAVSLLILPLLKSHDRSALEIHCYASVARADDVTKIMRENVEVWRDVSGISDRELAEKIRQDQIDILVDLTMHMDHHRLLTFATKPAPVQVTWLGYPGGTGLSAMDYRLTDPYLDPPGVGDEFYVEKSIRLPDTFWIYDAMESQTQINSLPALKNEFVTFGCLNNFCKINSGVIETWARIMTAVERSRLLLLAPAGSAWEWVLQKFGEHGIKSERIERIAHQSRLDYLRTFNRIDISLDTLPCNGHTTSLDSFWMGVPVVTQIGRTIVGRAGLSQLSNLNLSKLAGKNADEFVSIACDLANDLPGLAEIRRVLRTQMVASPLMDGKRFAASMETAFRQMWRTWCARQLH